MNKSKEVKAGLGYMVGNVLIKGISFITLPVFTRLLTTEDFGIYNTYGAYASILAILIGLGMYSSVKNASYDYKEEINTYITTLISILGICAGIVMLIGVVFSKEIKALTNFSHIIIIMMVFEAFGTAILNIANSELSLKYDYKRYLVYAGINTIGNISLSLILINFISENRALGRIIGSALPIFGLGCYIAYSYLRKTKHLFNKKMARYALIFGLPLVWHYLAQNIASQFDRIMITSLVGNSQTGIYSFVYTIANIFSILFYSTDNVWSVWFYKQMEEKNYEEIRKNAERYIVLFDFIAILMMVCSREIIMLMSSIEYWKGADLFMPIIVGLFFLFLYTIPVSIEYYYKETKYIAITTFASAIVNIVLNYIFIQLLGYKAAAYTTACSYFVMFITHWIISKRVMRKFCSEDLFKLGVFFKHIILIVIVAFVVFKLNSLYWIKYMIFIILGGILLMLYKNEVKQFLFLTGVIKKK